jgi:hypothetical protein
MKKMVLLVAGLLMVGSIGFAATFAEANGDASANRVKVKPTTTGSAVTVERVKVKPTTTGSAVTVGRVKVKPTTTGSGITKKALK